MAVMTAPVKILKRILSFMERIKLLMNGSAVNGLARSSKPFIDVKTEAIPKVTIPMLLIFIGLKKVSNAPMIASGTKTLSRLKVISSVLKVVPILVPKMIPID